MLAVVPLVAPLLVIADRSLGIFVSRVIAVIFFALLGYAYASRHQARAAYRWSADASVYVSAAARRLGVGRRLYTALFALARLQGYRAVHAGITLPNPASVGLHEALGFTPVRPGLTRPRAGRSLELIDELTDELDLTFRGALVALEGGRH